MVTITLYMRQQKRHWYIEQSFGLCWRGRGWDDLGEWHWNMYNIIYETSRQSRFDAWYRMLGAGALGWPRGMVWGGRREEGSGWRIHVYLWRIHFDIWQNQYNIVKLKNKIKLKKNKETTTTHTKQKHLYFVLNGHNKFAVEINCVVWIAKTLHLPVICQTTAVLFLSCFLLKVSADLI